MSSEEADVDVEGLPSTESSKANDDQAIVENTSSNNSLNSSLSPSTAKLGSGSLPNGSGSTPPRPLITERGRNFLINSLLNLKKEGKALNQSIY